MSESEQHEPQTPKVKPSQRDLLLELAPTYLWRDAEGTGYATILVNGHFENHAIRSTTFKSWFVIAFGERHRVRIANEWRPQAPTEQAIKDAVNTIDAWASRGVEHTPVIRVASDTGSLFLDLGQENWDCVKANETGWTLVPLPLPFVRPKGMLPLPTPVVGGQIDELRRFVNVKENDDFWLIVVWLLWCLQPNGPFPILILNGEQGSAKSTACRMLRRLIDPHRLALRSLPKDEVDLVLAAKNGWILAIDNLSFVRNDFSDALCRIATKGGIGKRELYSDGAEFITEVCRPILLNGITAFAQRADLADRSIVINLPAISDRGRRTEKELWTEFEAALPRILGALLSLASNVMAFAGQHNVTLNTNARMADFAVYGETVFRSLDVAPGIFEQVYARNRAATSDATLEGDAVAMALLLVLQRERKFEGTTTNLLETLGRTEWAHRDPRWPRDANGLHARLMRASPLLRQRGVDIERHRSADRDRTRILTIRLRV